MNRTLTNAVRFILDECVPPLIRDSKAFMYPFFWFAYRGHNIRQAMEFKRLVHEWSPQEYSAFYESINTISRNRKTDLNEACIRYIIANLDSSSQSLLDVGCGRGYFLSRLTDSKLELTGCDVVNKLEFCECRFVTGNVEYLPFRDNEFDIVTCSHTLEHVIDLSRAVSELTRVARRQIVISVPCQRPYYYTLDEHLHFFPYKEKLTSVVGIADHVCTRLRGDWVYVGYLRKTQRATIEGRVALRFGEHHR